MTQGNRIIELTIVEALDVRRYAKEVLLAQPLRENVERALIEDDRARAVVEQFSDAPTAKGAACLVTLLREAYDDGARTISAYYSTARRKDLSLRTKAFVVGRLSLRKELVRKIADLMSTAMPDSQYLTPFSAADGMCDFAIRNDVHDQLEAADRRFLQALRTCFEAPSSPHYKAKLADIIAALENERAHIRWARRSAL
jgi:hypothetical protein